MTGWAHYLHAGFNGKSKWYHWVGGFWLIFIGGLIAQTVLTGPIMPLVESTDPELSSQITAAGVAMLERADFRALAIFGAGFMLSGVIATGFWIAARTIANQKTAQILGLIALLFTVIAFSCGYKLAPIMSDAESTRLMTQAMSLNPLIYICFLITFPLA